MSNATLRAQAAVCEWLVGQGLSFVSNAVGAPGSARVWYMTVQASPDAPTVPFVLHVLPPMFGVGSPLRLREAALYAALAQELIETVPFVRLVVDRSLDDGGRLGCWVRAEFPIGHGDSPEQHVLHGETIQAAIETVQRGALLLLEKHGDVSVVDPATMSAFQNESIPPASHRAVPAASSG